MIDKVKNLRQKIHIILGFLVGVLALSMLTSFLLLNYFVRKELSKPQRFGVVSIEPIGFHGQGWMQWGWDELRIYHPQWHVFVNDISLGVHPSIQKAYPAPIHLSSQRISVVHKATQQAPKPQKGIEKLSIPKISFPLRASTFIKELELNIGEQIWTADSLVLNSQGRHQLKLSWDKIQGSHLAKEVHGQISFTQAQDFLEIKGEIHHAQDSIKIFAETPNFNAHLISGEVSLQVSQPKSWVPPSMDLPLEYFNNIKVFSSLEFDATKLSLSHKSKINLNINDVWELPPLNLSAEVTGDEKLNLKALIKAVGPEKESAFLQINARGIDTVDVVGKIENTWVELGNFWLPLDFNISSVTLRDKKLELDAHTPAGSTIIGFIDDLYSLKGVKFKVDALGQEPWFVTWCEGNLITQYPTVAIGEFDYEKGEMYAHINSGVQEAYVVKADYLEAQLRLDVSGVYISDGYFINRGVEHSFFGEVIWDEDLEQKVHFTAKQENGGQAEYYFDFDDSMYAQAQGIITAELPFLDTNFLRGLDGIVDATIDYKLTEDIGNLAVELKTDINNLPVNATAYLQRRGESLDLNNAHVYGTGYNLLGSAQAVLDANYDFTLKNAQISARDLTLPEILKVFRDTTLKVGVLNGDFTYDLENGVDGELNIDTIIFNEITQENFSFYQTKIKGLGKNLSLTSNAKLGNNSKWDTKIQAYLDHFLLPEKTASAELVMKHGGIAKLHGTLDTNFAWQGKAQLQGPWEIIEDGFELTHSDVSANLSFDYRQKTAGISGDITVDSVELTLDDITIPLKAKGNIAENIIHADSILLLGHNQTSIMGKLGYNIETLEFEYANANSPQYDLLLNHEHNISLLNISAQATLDSSFLDVYANVPTMLYNFDNDDFGKIDLKLNGNLHYSHPLTDQKLMRNPQLNGKIQIENLNYDQNFKFFDINYIKALLVRMIGPILTRSPSTPSGGQVAISQPIELNVHLVDNSFEPLTINTNIAQFPFTVDLRLLGSSETPILDGDINAVGTGFIGLDGIETLDLKSLRIWWPNVEPLDGELSVATFKNLPFCKQIDNKNENCDIGLSFSGKLTEPIPESTADCEIEATPAQIYYSIFIGCIADEDYSGGGIDRDEIAGKVLSKFVTEGINRGLGGEYVGNIGLKFRFLDEVSVDERDSNYIRIPIKLDRWVKNLNLIMAYSQDRSQHPRYDQSYEFGLTYSLGLEDSTDLMPNHIDPTLDFSGQLIGRRYPATEIQKEKESRLEKNLGVLYRWRFWDLFGDDNKDTPSPVVKDE